MNLEGRSEDISPMGARWLVLVIFSLAFHGASWAQDVQRITGRIINVETQAPIPFASVGIPGRQVGTSADLGGFLNWISIPSSVRIV